MEAVVARLLDRLQQVGFQAGAEQRRGERRGVVPRRPCRAAAPFRHCQRWMRSFTVTAAPCAGKSCK